MENSLLSNFGKNPSTNTYSTGLDFWPPDKKHYIMLKSYVQMHNHIYCDGIASYKKFLSSQEDYEYH